MRSIRPVVSQVRRVDRSFTELTTRARIAALGAWLRVSTVRRSRTDPRVSAVHRAGSSIARHHQPPPHSPSMSLRYHEIAEAGHRILNPFTATKLDLLGDICRLTP